MTPGTKRGTTIFAVGKLEPCKHERLTNVRPWPELGRSVAECVECHSTVTVEEDHG